MKEQTLEALEAELKMLQGDIDIFGPAGSDLARIANLKSKIKKLNHDTKK